MDARETTYLPGHGDRTTRMLTGRGAERAAFVPADRLAGARVVDLGCGPGTLTAAVARRVGAEGRLVALDVADDARRAAAAALRGVGTARVTVLGGSATALPLADGSVDLVFSHALLEHLPDPAPALAEIRRVLRPGGAVALVSSDWSGALVEPDDADARVAVDGYRRTRRRAGADPDAGARLPTWVADAGFDVGHEAARWREDLVGADLARYIGERLPDDPDLADARAAAARWARQPTPARVRQRWVEVVGVITP